MLQLQNSTKINIVHNFHSFAIIYLLFGFLIPSQRIILLFLLPTLQFQFLINDNMCILTQLENYYIEDDNKQNDSFVDKKFKEYNIHLTENTREKIIYTSVYTCFLLNYFLL
jgi:hypothetical protein